MPKGMESGINDKTEESIVMHGAPYINENIIHARRIRGRIGVARRY
jgi:hypothetical protein